MRRRDKSKNIAKANILVEQRYLESKGLLKEIHPGASIGEVSLKLDNGGVFTGEPRMKPEHLSLQIGRNGYFSFWEGEFSSGGVKIVGGADPQSQAWLEQTIEDYKVAERKAYPEKFAEREGSRKIIIKSREDWTREMTNLKSKGYMYKSQHDINPERDFISMHNYAKYPYEVIVDDSAKTIDFGEHTLKQD